MAMKILILTIVLACQASTRMTGMDTSQDQSVMKTVSDFLIWYRNNYDSLHSLPLVPESIDADTSNKYRVSTANLNSWINQLESGGYLSDYYLNSLKSYVLECDKILIENPQTDGPPEGLEYDLILKTQEVEETLQQIENAKYTNITITTDIATVQVLLVNPLQITLLKREGEWRINKIEIKP